MVKKVLDILPPRHPSQKEEESLPEREEFLPKYDLPEEKGVRGIWFLFFLLLIVAVGIAFRISKAEIAIFPETEMVNFEAELTVNTKIEESDFEKGIIPGELFKIERSLSETFTSSGKSLAKAEGVIRLYNAYTTKSETWLAGTRFVSADGKVFKSKNQIRVPGAGISNGKMTPSYVDVSVIAAEAGEEYNIDPSYFSIYVYRGTPRYTKFYGESSEAMQGGGESPSVTKTDIEGAEEYLIETIKEKCEQDIGSEIGGESVLLEDVLKTEIIESSSLAKFGDEVGEFNFTIKAESSTIIFEKQEVENFVKNIILSRISEENLLYEESLSIEYTAKVVNFECGKTIVSLSFSAKTYPKLDLPGLKKDLIGKSSGEAKAFLKEQPGVADAEVKFWPFWVECVPKDLDKIKTSYPIID